MPIRDLVKNRLLYLDGAMGTMLQAAGLQPGENPDIWSITHPDTIRALHRAYFDAGCNIASTNTFGCTAYKLAGTGYSAGDVASAGVGRVKEAAAQSGGTQPKFVALDIGPTGQLLQPLGDLPFEDAVAMYYETIAAGAAAGADMVLIETMSDSYELKAAVLAARESCDLPIFATVTVGANGRLLTGGDVHTVVALLEGLRVDALGLNCSLGPQKMLPLLKELRGIASTPIIITPNAGLPREGEGGGAVYDTEPYEFAAVMREVARQGARVLGGCCGTTPAHMRAVIEATSGLCPLPVQEKGLSVVSSYGRAVTIGGAPVWIGERINPTGKPRLKQALRQDDMDYVLQQGIAQAQAGAHILDVNCGLPGIDEATTLVKAMAGLQSVLDTPLQLDSADVNALALAMRCYNGKPMVNSVNGKAESMRAVFPLVQKYGGLVVALTLDETGIPETIEGRLKIAETIITTAAEYGIKKKDIIIDPLTMTVSAGQKNALITLDALRLIKERLRVNTILGVSNVSFGLPARDSVNAAFFAMALYAGLSAAIINPNNPRMMETCYAASALLNHDPQCGGLIKYFGDPANMFATQQADTPPAGTAQKAPAPVIQPILPGARTAPADTDMQKQLQDAIVKGLKTQAGQLALAAMAGRDALEIINGALIPALNYVGEGFEKGSLFLPQLLMSAEAAKSAFAVLREGVQGQEGESAGEVVIATVKGDVHDIGKNIVKAMLESYRFHVTDLGKDVPPEQVAHAANRTGTRLVGLSALMTTTVTGMRDTIALLKEKAPQCRVVVGGAVLTEAYAREIGADFYAPDAMAAVRYAQQVYGKERARAVKTQNGGLPTL